ncbi:MAG: hypothetical protein KY443_09875 [Actinobacteria bacterium]|nr:hypothetical protein [Actinomycetota bacterium]
MLRFALLAVMVGMLGLGTALPAQSLNPDVWSWVVSCADSTPTTSDSTGGIATTMPSGVYAVTVEGACLHTPATLQDLNVGTPCALPGVGPVPCTTVTTVHNVPGAACSMVTTAQTIVWPCIPAVGESTCVYTVTVNGQCLTRGTVGLVNHLALTPMSAKFEDNIYEDNTGFFVVTAKLTAL